MAIPKKIIKFIEGNKIKYETLEHKTVYTAFDKARTLKVPEKIIGKVLAVKMDKDFGIVLIPADKNLDRTKLKRLVNARLKGKNKKLVEEISFATETWIKKNLKGIKMGAIPPFGNLWKMPVFVDRGLMKNLKIIVPAGDYNWSFKFSSVNLKKLVPDLIMGNFTQAKVKKGKKKKEGRKKETRLKGKKKAKRRKKGGEKKRMKLKRKRKAGKAKKGKKKGEKRKR